ncbi:MAG: helix-turn-helix domain-containing protein [Bacteroidales bacterium]|nr:helix-turn-helix domain-containing protein [Bacteroidales bacterium]
MVTITSFAATTASYYDGSLWMAGEYGIVRVGRNGRSIQYTGKELGVDRVLDILADSSENIWYLGDDGVVRSYSFLDGFATHETLPIGVESLAFDPVSGRVFASTKAALFSWKPGAEALVPVLEMELENRLLHLDFSPDGTVWVACEKSLFRLDNTVGPSLVSASGGGVDISNSIPIKIETSATRTSWVAVFVAFLLGFSFSLLLRKKRSSKAPKAVRPKESKASDAPAKESSEVAPEPVLFPSAPVAQDDFVAQVERIIRENIATQKFGVDEIAAITGLSRIHLNRKLKAAGCPSPSILLRNARMEYAATLIRQGELPMQEIALRCGFSSASYFATAFRDYYGVTPTEYNPSS